MIIQVTSGLGTGETELSAFDLALHQAGIADFNLIYLSSIIPPGSTVVEQHYEADTGNIGDRLYLVIAHNRVSHRNEESWAGLGWVQSLESGGGLFAEHVGATQDQVIEDIRTSLIDMCSHREDEFGEIKIVTVGGRCVDRPICALVAAIYQRETW